jgi:hypothetical protein
MASGELLMASLPRRAVAAARWLVVLEIGVWRSLFLWLTRRVPGRAPDVEDFPHAKEVSPLLIAFISVSTLEVPVVHLLLLRNAVRLAALVAGVWGLLWMLGYLASMRVFRHLVDDDGLRVRHGTSVDLRIPWHAVAGVTARRGRVPAGKPCQVEEAEGGAVAYVAVLKQTRVAIALHRPTAVELPDGPRDVVELRFYVDDPRAFVTAARTRVARRRPPELLAT